MIILKNKVYIHLPKCAGTSIIKSIKNEYYNDIEYFLFHQSANAIPDQYKNYKIYGLVRNPLTWYESYYNFHIKNYKKMFSKGKFKPIYILASILFLYGKNKIHTFDEFLNNALNYKDVIADKSNQQKIRKIFLDIPFNLFSKILIENMNNMDVEKTLYQDMYKKFTMDKVNKYKMETELNEIQRIFNLKEIKYENTSKKYCNVTINHKKRILKEDRILFDKMGYNKIII